MVEQESFLLCHLLEVTLDEVNTGAVVQLVRIPACHAGGREFESRPFRQSYRKL